MPKIISFVVYLLVENDTDAPLRGTLRSIAEDSTRRFPNGLSLLDFLRQFRQRAATSGATHFSSASHPSGNGKDDENENERENP